MSDAATAPVAAPAAPADATLLGAAPAPAPAADTPAAAPAAAAPVAAPAAAPVAAPAAAPAAEPTPEEKAAAEAKAAAAVKGAPEKYDDFKLPETLKADAPIMGKFAGLAKELNLPQEAAQKIVDLAAEMQTGSMTALHSAIETQATEWAAASKVDKEFGGDKFDENLALAKTALDQFGTPEFKNLLNASKLGNHPEVLRFMVRAGKAISQDGFVAGRASNGQRPSHADVLYKH